MISTSLFFNNIGRRRTIISAAAALTTTTPTSSTTKAAIVNRIHVLSRLSLNDAIAPTTITLTNHRRCFSTANTNTPAKATNTTNTTTINTPTTTTTKNSKTMVDVRVVYSFAHDQAPSSVRAKAELIGDGSINVNSIVDILVNDGVDLRTVKELRLWHIVDEGFVAVPTDGLVRFNQFFKDGLVKLQFVKHSSRRVIGPSFALDPNFGLLVDILNPVINLRYSAASKNVHRYYRAFISTIGLRFDVSLRFQAVFWIKPPFTETFRHERIELGRGIDICWGLLFTYVNFKNHSGGIVMIGIPVGLSAGVSFIRGGYLVPLEHPENEPIPQWQVERDRIEVEAKAASKSDSTSTTSKPQIAAK